MKERSLVVHDLEWKETHQYAAGAKAKELVSDADKGLTAILLKLEPDWSMSEHAHVHTEIHYVLEGEYESQGQVYREGTFRLIPKETNHGPFRTRIGATVLVLWVDVPH